MASMFHRFFFSLYQRYLSILHVQEVLGQDFLGRLYQEKADAQSSCIISSKKSKSAWLCLMLKYRDRRVKRQSHWTETLFRRLVKLHLSNFVPLEIRPIGNAQFAEFIFWWGSKISVAPHQKTPPLRSSKKFCRI